MPQAAAFFTAALTSVGVGAATAGILGGVLVNLLTSVAVSALSQMLAPDAPEVTDPGIKTSVTLTGDTNPRRFIMGRYATAGTAVFPGDSHGDSGETPNAFLTQIVILSDKPGVTVNRVIVDGEYASLVGPAHPSFGLKVNGRFDGRMWVKVKDNATSADSMLIAKYGSQPKRPWQSDMIGRGLTYSIQTMRYGPKTFSGGPKVVFEVDGIPLYDPRNDTTVGGSGAQRWNNENTWAQTDNPVVMIYNILRGVTFQDGVVYGLGVAAADLPLSTWFAAMNVCDQAVSLSGGGTEPRYRAGCEVDFSMEPGDVIAELLKACAGRIAEVGGIWKIKCGGPGLPVYFFTDEDVVISREQMYTPHPGLNETYNAVYASYPAPGNLWEVKNAPPRIDTAAQATDQGRLLPADVSFASVPYKRQVQRLARAALRDHRRMARHVVTLPPPSAVLEPLDAVSWTSDRNGYTAKVFTVSEIADDWRSLCQTVSLREHDPTDYDWAPGDELPDDDTDDGVLVPAAQAVTGWAVAAGTLFDDMGSARRPAINLSWTGTGLEDVTSLEWELRLTSSSVIARRGSTTNIEAGELLIGDSILPGTAYEARARFIALERETTWTSWTGVTTDAIYIDDQDAGFPDIDGNLIRNGRFKYGDLRWWGALPTGWTLKSRALGGNAQITSCPTEYMLEVDAVGLTEEAIIDGFDCDPSDRFSIAFRHAGTVAGTTIVGLEMVIRYYDVTNSLLRTDVFDAASSSATWSQHRKKGSVAPAGSVKGTVAIRARDIFGFGSDAIKKVYITQFRLFREQVSNISDFTAAGLALTNSYQVVALCTNSDDADAAAADSLVMFSCTCLFNPPASATQMIVVFELKYPNGTLYEYTFTAKNFDGLGANNVVIPVAFNRLLSGTGALPETVRVRAKRDSAAYDITISDASLIVQSVKR